MAEALQIDEAFNLQSILNNIKYDLKQNIITCSTPLSLQYILLNKIAIMLCKAMHHECLEFLDSKQSQGSSYQMLKKNMEQLENKVLERSLSLTIPKNCKEALKPVINSVWFEIEKYFTSQIFLNSANCDKLKIHWVNLVFTDEGKLNYFKTAIQLLELTNLSTEDKYVIACSNCLEDQIRVIQDKISSDFLKSLIEYSDCYYKDLHLFYKYKPFHLVFYWTFYVRGEQERFSEITNDMNINLFIIKWAIFYRNEVALQYFWENLADEAIKENLLDLIHFSHFRGPIFKDLYCSNTLLYLFKQKPNISLKIGGIAIDPINFVENTFVSYNLIRQMNRISKICAVPNINRAHELIMAENIYDLFNIKATGYELKILSFQQYKHCYNDIERLLKTGLEINIREIFEIAFENYEYDQNELSLKLLTMLISNRTDIEFIFSQFGLEACAFLLENKCLYGLKFIINKVCKTKESVNQFKKVFCKDKLLPVCSYIIYEKRYEYDFLNEILIYFFSEEEIIRFKTQLPYIKKESCLFYIINNANNNDDLVLLLNNFLSFCFDNREYEIKRCKTEIFVIDKMAYYTIVSRFCTKISKLIKEGKWDSVDRYWRWIFFDESVDKRPVKEKLERLVDIFYLISAKDCFGLVKMFITLSFEKGEIQDLKTYLKHSYELLSIVKSMLQYDKHARVDEFLDWCYSGIQNDIDNFKEKFMVSLGCEILFDLIRENNIETHKVKELFEWFKPSFESAKKLEKVFIDYVKSKKEENNLCIDVVVRNLLEERAIEILKSISGFVKQNDTFNIKREKIEQESKKEQK